MKKILNAILLAVLMLSTIAGIAYAGPDCDKHPENPNCVLGDGKGSDESGGTETEVEQVINVVAPTGGPTNPVAIAASSGSSNPVALANAAALQDGDDEDDDSKTLGGPWEHVGPANGVACDPNKPGMSSIKNPHCWILIDDPAIVIDIPVVTEPETGEETDGETDVIVGDPITIELEINDPGKDNGNPELGGSEDDSIYRFIYVYVDGTCTEDCLPCWLTEVLDFLFKFAAGVALFILLALAMLAVPSAFAQGRQDIYWDASSNAVGYNIYRTKTADSCPTDPLAPIPPECIQVNQTPVQGTSGTCMPQSPPASLRCFTDAGLAVTGRWFYVVRAVGDDNVESANGLVSQSPPQPGSTADHLMVVLHPEAPKRVRKNPL